jgi:hypothetical protein
VSETLTGKEETTHEAVETVVALAGLALLVLPIPCVTVRMPGL